MAESGACSMSNRRRDRTREQGPARGDTKPKSCQVEISVNNGTAKK